MKHTLSWPVEADPVTDQKGRDMRKRWRVQLAAYGLLVGSLVAVGSLMSARASARGSNDLSVNGISSAAGTGPASFNELIEAPNPDAVGSDAAAASKSLGIPLDEARQALALQPEKGALLQALALGNSGFGGMYVSYDPYQVNVLAEPGRGTDVRDAVMASSPKDLIQFVSVTETPYTENALLTARAELEKQAQGLVAASDIDLEAGKVMLTVPTSEEATSLREVVAASALLPDGRVEVVVGGMVNDSSYGGRKITADQSGFSDVCTSGFSVTQTSGGSADGITDAGHCNNNNGLELNPDVNLTFQAQQYGGNQDVQWFTTSNTADANLVKDSQGTRSITSRTARGSMSPGDIVCHFGATSGYGCGEINSVNYDPGSGFNATFISVRNDTTAAGDSGGPWYAGNSAFGSHIGEDTSTSHPIFMAQNYMNALSIQVKIS